MMWRRWGEAGAQASEQRAEPDLIFPKRHSDLFKIILNEQNLRFDREGQPRTFYSLRHTYICLRLMEAADIYQIARNCRTSVEMIEKYYASHIKNMLDAAAINVMRPRTKKKPKAEQPPAAGMAQGPPGRHRAGPGTML